MGRNCNLDLRLFPLAPSSSTSDDNSSTTTEQSSHVKGQQPITSIFHKGRICTFDLTEIQARAIIMFASREMEMAKTASSTQLWRPPSSSSGLSMKRSLQRFLQERRKRARAISPYKPIR